MIQRFEHIVRQRPHDIFFQYVATDGIERSFTYEETRFAAAGLALQLRERGFSRGAAVVVDLPNCPEYVFMILAAAYGGFAIVALNHRLTEDEKIERIVDLRIAGAADLSKTFDRRAVARLLEGVPYGYDAAYRSEAAMASPHAGSMHAEALAGRPHDTDDAEGRKPGFMARLFGNGGSDASTTRHGGRTGRAGRADAAAEASAVDSRSIVNFAERARASFDRNTSALVMFTSGTTGRPKAVSLSWRNLLGAAESSNKMLSRRGEGLWQAALPLFHIGGLQIVIRSILNETPFILYRRFDAARVLADAHEYGATHLSVVDKMLQELLALKDETIARYRCILLGGAATNPATLQRAIAMEAAVYASYGMTETASQIASMPVDASFDGSLKLLPGYEAHIVNPDGAGTGQLAVRGPGIFAGYLNARTAFTVDGFFLTGDTASLTDGKLQVFERSSDMFVSGGENVYPAEIREKLLRIPQVGDAYVFGVEDETWGRRPVAFVERSVSGEGLDTGFVDEDSGRRDAEPHGNHARAASSAGLDSPSPFLFADAVLQNLEGRLSKLYRPKHVLALDSFPRTAIGKVDRTALEHRYSERIEVKRITLYRIDQNLVTPFETAKTTMHSRESIIIEVEDREGRTGIGECVAFPTDWYLPETLDQDARVLEECLIPLVLSHVFLHPSEVSACFDACKEADGFPLAKGALEPALWDLYGKIVKKPLWQLIGGTKAKRGDSARWVTSPGNVTLATAEVRAGVVIGIMPIDRTLEEVRRYVAAGYERVKLKIRPGDDVARVRAVREAFPRLTIMLDANQSYVERDMPALKSLDALGIRCIEEPLDPRRTPPVGPRGIFARLARLQREVRMPVCLDESVVTADDLTHALTFSDITCYALKIGKLGGVKPALDFYEEAQRRGIEIWMAGMYETGVSKRLHAAFETLLGVNIPGDISETSRYFEQDITTPPFAVERGVVALNMRGYEAGLGCVLDHDALERVLVDKREFIVD